MLRAPLFISILIALTSGCGGGDDSSGAVDAAATFDAAEAADAAAPDAVSAEPTTPFVASAPGSGRLALDQVAMRETFVLGGQTQPSYISISLNVEGMADSCSVRIAPAFTAFETGSTSTRSFKTLAFDMATSEVLEDGCGLDDAYILADLKRQYGKVEVGFARARFDEDRPYLDVFVDADNSFPGSTANIVYAGGGTGHPMSEAGVVDNTVKIEPVSGTLDTGLYLF